MRPHGMLYFLPCSLWAVIREEVNGKAEADAEGRWTQEVSLSQSVVVLVVFEINERIRAREVRVIDEAGNQLGVMSLFDAMKAARDGGLDVVEISPNAVPPVCKLVDYGKFLYEQNKKAHEQKKHQKSSHIKEVKFRPSTAEHDYQVRKNQIIRFLGEGYKVKAMIFHRGREMAHQDVGRGKMERLLRDIIDHAQVEFGPRMEANILLALLAPKKAPRPRVHPARRRRLQAAKPSFRFR